MIAIYYLSNTKFIKKVTLRNANALPIHSAINLTINIKFDISGRYKYCFSFFSSEYPFLRI